MSGTFALLAALPTVFPAPLALSPTPPTAPRTASTPELLLEEPLLEADLLDRDLLLALDFDALAPLLELRDLALVDFAPVDFGFELFALAALVLGELAELAFGFDAFDFDDDFARFGADRFFVDWVLD